MTMHEFTSGKFNEKFISGSFYPIKSCLNETQLFKSSGTMIFSWKLKMKLMG